MPRVSNIPRPIVIVGPTAGGKSELAVMLAERIGVERGIPGEILGADSMQIYRHMDAGTAKPSPEQRRRATHHLIDIVEPTERFTVADWLALADALLEELPARGVTPIVVGGTNLYLKALLEGLFEGPPLNEDLRATLAAMSNHELRDKLMKIDPSAAQRIHFNDRKRTIRAIEVHEQTGRRISELQTQWGGERVSGIGYRVSGTEQHDSQAEPHCGVTPDFHTRHPTPDTRAYRHNPILIGLHWPTELINRRINQRVKEMFFPPVRAAPAAPGDCGLASEALPDETRRLQAAGMLGPQAAKALGYQQVLDHLAGRCTLDEAFERTKILTRRFAKTQRTWLKRYTGVTWLDASAMTPEQLTEVAWGTVTAMSRSQS